MGSLFGKLFGSQDSKDSSTTSGDADFADFAGAPDPSPASIFAQTAVTDAPPAGPTGAAAPIPYTKWYRVWERTAPRDFIQEAVILPFIIIAVLVHLWGTKKNRRKANQWAVAHQAALEGEYARVGFGGFRKAPTAEDVEGSGLAQAMAQEKLLIPHEMMKQKSAQEYASYATGRQNVAFADIKISLYKRYNPLIWCGETAISLVMENFPSPAEKMELTIYPFDGKEAALVPVERNAQGQEALEKRKASSASAYDGFVWAVVHKDCMKKLRDERYDVSLTTTKDHAKLPTWATVMSESAEITEYMLTPDLIKAVEAAGQYFEYLVITDQPLDRPTKLSETHPHKRINLSLFLPSSDHYASTLPVFSYALRLPDQLVTSAHYRPEVMRRVRQTREDQIRKLQRADDDEKAEERAIRRDKEKKEKREATLNNMTAEEQRKYLEKEREKEVRKGQKRITQKQ